MVLKKYLDAGELARARVCVCVYVCMCVCANACMYVCVGVSTPGSQFLLDQFKPDRSYLFFFVRLRVKNRFVIRLCFMVNCRFSKNEFMHFVYDNINRTNNIRKSKYFNLMAFLLLLAKFKRASCVLIYFWGYVHCFSLRYYFN